MDPTRPEQPLSEKLAEQVAPLVAEGWHVASVSLALAAFTETGDDVFGTSVSGSVVRDTVLVMLERVGSREPPRLRP